MAREIKPSTVKLYTIAYNKIKKDFAGDLTDACAVIKFIYDLTKSDSTKKGYFSALNYFLKDSHPDIAELYRKEIKKFIVKLNIHEIKQEATEKEKVNYLSKDDLDKAFNEIVKCPDLPLIDKILIALYVKMPPTRLDYYNMQVFNKDTKDISGNYMIINPRSIKITISEHKTSGSFGKITKNVPLEITKMIREWRKAKPDATHIFAPPDWPSRHSFGIKIQKLLKRFTGKSIGVNLIRHAHVNHLLKDDTLLEKKVELAKEMGHSVTTQEKYRIKDV